MGSLLVIEDDPVIAELLRSVLEEGGYSAVVVRSLEEAPQRDYALVITDLVSADAYDLAEAQRWVASLRRRFPERPVVVCTAHRAAPDSAALGADAVLMKPFDVDELLALVDRLTVRGPR